MYLAAKAAVVQLSGSLAQPWFLILNTLFTALGSSDTFMIISCTTREEGTTVRRQAIDHTHIRQEA